MLSRSILFRSSPPPRMIVRAERIYSERSPLRSLSQGEIEPRGLVAVGQDNRPGRLRSAALAPNGGCKKIKPRPALAAQTESGGPSFKSAPSDFRSRTRMLCGSRLLQTCFTPESLWRSSPDLSVNVRSSEEALAEFWAPSLLQSP